MVIMKPCLRCGKRPKIIQNEVRGQTRIACTCGNTTGNYDSLNKAVEYWNNNCAREDDDSEYKFR